MQATEAKEAKEPRPKFQVRAETILQTSVSLARLVDAAGLELSYLEQSGWHGATARLELVRLAERLQNCSMLTDAELLRRAATLVAAASLIVRQWYTGHDQRPQSPLELGFPGNPAPKILDLRPAAPGDQRFNCPRCKGHTFAHAGEAFERVLLRRCSGGTPTGPCAFSWPSTLDHLYLGSEPCSEK